MANRNPFLSDGIRSLQQRAGLKNKIVGLWIMYCQVRKRFYFPSYLFGYEKPQKNSAGDKKQIDINAVKKVVCCLEIL